VGRFPIRYVSLTKRVSVLLVDPGPDDREATTGALADADDVRVVDAVDGFAAFDAALSSSVDCVVTEYDLPDGTGLDVARRVRERMPDTPCVLFTNASPAEIDTANGRDLVVEYHPKEMPDARASLVRLVKNVVAQRGQVAYPLPDEEDERLATLRQYDLPDFDAVTAFDRIAELARSHFGVNVAFVGLVDAHEERFVACQGADWETLDREDTICTHTILGDDVLVVEDVQEDDRFRHNETLAELHIRSYAGAPLTTPSGVTIGAFCLIDDDPRSYDDGQRADLRRFADEAMEQLELRRRLLGGDDGAGGTG
jgi:CheY-like chemotaxis protein